MLKFQDSVYKTWRNFWIAIGLFWPAYLYGAVIRKLTLSNYPLWGNMLVLCSPFALLFVRYFLHQSIQNNYFVFNYLLFKRKIPIKDICELSYEQRPAWRYLVIKFKDEKGNEKQKEWSVDFHDPIDIRKLNKILTKTNPNIEINFDEKFAKFMEEKKDIHKKAPTTVLGWVWFAMKWGGTTALINLGVLEFIRFVDPSVFK